jgi:hypothetical protein
MIFLEHCCRLEFHNGVGINKAAHLSLDTLMFSTRVDLETKNEQVLF